MFKRYEHPIISKKHRTTRYYSSLEKRIFKNEERKELCLVLSCSGDKQGNPSNPEELYIKLLDYLSEKLRASSRSIELEPDVKKKLESFGTFIIKARVVFYGSVTWKGTIKLIILKGERWG